MKQEQFKTKGKQNEVKEKEKLKENLWKCRERKKYLSILQWFSTIFSVHPSLYNLPTALCSLSLVPSPFSLFLDFPFFLAVPRPKFLIFPFSLAVLRPKFHIFPFSLAVPRPKFLFHPFSLAAPRPCSVCSLSFNSSPTLLFPSNSTPHVPSVSFTLFPASCSLFSHYLCSPSLLLISPCSHVPRPMFLISYFSLLIA